MALPVVAGFLARLAHMLIGAFSALITTYIGKLIAALGISIISYKGIEAIQVQFVNYLINQLGRMPSEVLQIFYLAGGGVALNWIMGGVSFAIGLMSVKKIGSIFTSK